MEALWTLPKHQVISQTQAWNTTVKYEDQIYKRNFLIRQNKKYQQHHLADAPLNLKNEDLVLYDSTQPNFTPYSKTTITQIVECPVRAPCSQPALKQ